MENVNCWYCSPHFTLFFCLFRIERNCSYPRTGKLFDYLCFCIAAPTGVLPPSSVVVLSATVIEAEWLHPTGNTGLLTEYILRGYNLDHPDFPIAETIYNDTANTLRGRTHNHYFPLIS